jgi:S-methylmethionine-dependent homocysteine/selenocysteine methylase
VTAKYRGALPQLGGGLFLTDGGIETSMIALEGLDLPEFAVFPLLTTKDGEAALRRYFRAYVEIACRWGAGLVLETATWRASADWGAKLGFTSGEVRGVNRKAVRLLEELRVEAEDERTQVVISGCLGPRYGGYDPASAMSEREAQAYHREQIETLAGAAADMIGALTIDNAEEAVGIVRAAERAGMPVAISFTVETDGRLASGQSLQRAVEQVDEATSAYPSYYMINCAHPSHFEAVLVGGGAWVERIRGLRANASHLSHAELDELPAPDAGDPEELSREYARLKGRLPQLNVFGGCCGTDHRHLEHIAAACVPLFRRSI